MSKSIVTRRSLIKQLGGAAFLAAPVFRATLNEAGAATPLRFIVVTFGGGAQFAAGSQPNRKGNYFRSLNHNFNYAGLMAPFSPYQSDILLLDKFGNLALTDDNGHIPQSLLTGDSRGQGDDKTTTPADMTSIDQVIARAIGTQTRFSSLQFGVNCPPGDQFYHFSNGVRLQTVNDPRIMFSRLFMGATPMPSPGPSGSPQKPPAGPDPQAMAAIQALRARKLSVLDLLKNDIVAIKAVAGGAERPKLEEHLNSLRELEKGLPNPTPGTTPVGGPAPVGPPPMSGAGCGPPALAAGTDIQTTGPQMNELLFQSINCDLTRVATMNWLTTSDDKLTSWKFLGVNRFHHDMQHNPAPDFNTVQTWILSQIAGLIKRLKETPEGSGSMLDNCAVLVISEQSDGRFHDGSPTIGFVAGKAGGAIRPGRTLMGNQSPLNNLFIALAKGVGVNLTTFGEAKFVTTGVSLT